MYPTVIARNRKTNTGIGPARPRAYRTADAHACTSHAVPAKASTQVAWSRNSTQPENVNATPATAAHGGCAP